MSAWGPALLYMALIFVLSSQSKLPTAPGIFGWDKLQHLIAYGVMGILLFRAASLSPLARASAYRQAFVIGAIYGALDEYHQSFVPGRNMDFMDWATDVIGLLLGLAILEIARRRNRNGG